MGMGRFGDLFTPIALIVWVWLVVFVIISRIHGRFKTPRGRKRFQRRLTLWFSLPALLVVAGWHLATQPVTVTTFALLCAPAAIAWRLISGSADDFNREETVANYAADRRHCGQCEYDLTGNQSGVCPECGWQIPQHVPASHVPWAMWWRRWRIEHLDDWRKTLWSTACATITFAALAIVMLFLHSLPGAVIAGLMCLMFLINTGRVIAYGKKQGSP